MFILYSTMCQESKKKICHGHVFKNYVQSGKWKLFNNGKKSSKVINFVVDFFLRYMKCQELSEVLESNILALLNFVKERKTAKMVYIKLTS